jgi:hypothetical protein
MQLIYNSDAFAVMQIEADGFVPEAPSEEAGAHMTALPEGTLPLGRGGYEIVDKHARREIFLEGFMAEEFKKGVEALNEGSPTTDDYDAFMEGFSGLMQQPVVVH